GGEVRSRARRSGARSLRVGDRGRARRAGRARALPLPRRRRLGRVHHRVRGPGSRRAGDGPDRGGPGEARAQGRSGGRGNRVRGGRLPGAPVSGGPRGYSLPLSPEGTASLVPSPPWHYVGDFIVIEYWADPDAVAAVLPPRMAPFADDPGRCAALFVDWQS